MKYLQTVYTTDLKIGFLEVELQYKKCRVEMDLISH